MEDKADPKIPQAILKKKIEQNEAEITPLVAQLNSVKEIRDGFRTTIKIQCDTAAANFKQRGGGQYKITAQDILLNDNKRLFN